MKYTSLIIAFAIGAIIFLWNYDYWPASIAVIAVIALLTSKRTDFLSIFLLILAFILIWLGSQWIGAALFMAGVILILYSPLDKTRKSAWQEMKKADAPYPAARIEADLKNFSKGAAELIVQPQNTEINSRAMPHKTPQAAKNFFTELKELFK